jgi:hypothetical protein
MRLLNSKPQFQQPMRRQNDVLGGLTTVIGKNVADQALDIYSIYIIIYVHKLHHISQNLLNR